MKKTAAIVFAAGLGTRLHPLTLNRPKALVLYRDKPLIEHVLDKIIAAGICNIVVNVHHFPDQIMEFVRGKRFEAEVRFSDERAYLRDTAGGLKYAEPLFSNSETLLLYNVDVISTIDIRQMLAYHERCGSEVTLAVRQRESKRYLLFNKEDFRLCGWKNNATGEMRTDIFSSDAVELAFSGIHVMNREMVHLIPTVEKLSLTPFYLQLMNKHKIIGYLHQNDEWMDVGKYEEYRNILK